MSMDANIVRTDTHNSFHRTATATVLSLSLSLPVYSVWHYYYYYYELRSRWYGDMVVCWFVFNLAHCKQCVASIHRPTYARLLSSVYSQKAEGIELPTLHTAIHLFDIDVRNIFSAFLSPRTRNKCSIAYV